MYYCFVEEDLIDLCDNDPLIIQAKYAKSLGRYCCCGLLQGTIFDHKSRLVTLKNKRVLLRSTYNSIGQAIELLTTYGAILLETISDIYTIEHWDALSLHRRPIFIAQAAEVLNTSFSSEVEEFLLKTPHVFIKSRKKGFSVQISSKKLLQNDVEALKFFRTHCSRAIDELLISESLLIKSDSLGLRETRHFVFDGAIANSSRTLHSIKHAVPSVLLEKARKIVDVLSRYDGFPKNYVIDMGEFERAGEVFPDIIELNPISSSLCYVNNSIFDEMLPEAVAIQRRTGMGAEYCYDAVEHPERYPQNRYSGAFYTYINPEHYRFY